MGPSTKSSVLRQVIPLSNLRIGVEFGAGLEFSTLLPWNDVEFGAGLGRSSPFPLGRCGVRSRVPFLLPSPGSECSWGCLGLLFECIFLGELRRQSILRSDPNTLAALRSIHGGYVFPGQWILLYWRFLQHLLVCSWNRPWRSVWANCWWGAVLSSEISSSSERVPGCSKLLGSVYGSCSRCLQDAAHSGLLPWTSTVDHSLFDSLVAELQWLALMLISLVPLTVGACRLNRLAFGLRQSVLSVYLGCLDTLRQEPGKTKHRSEAGK